MQATLAPVDDSQRLPALDAARGFALLGILMVNIQLFGKPFSDFISLKPEAEEGWPAWVAYYFVKVLCEYKFFTLFSTLFGMGLAMQLGRAKLRGESFGWLGARRIIALGIIGALHATLLWAGDILFMYAIVAVPFLFVVRRTARTLLIIAAVSMFLASSLSGCFGAFMVMGEREKQRVGMQAGEAKAASTTAPDSMSTDQAEVQGNAIEAISRDTEASAGTATQPTSQQTNVTGSETDSADSATEVRWTNGPIDRLLSGWRKGDGRDPASPLWREVEVQCFKEGPTIDAVLMRSMQWIMILVAMTISGGYFWIFAMFCIGAALLKLDIFAPHRRPWLTKMALLGWGLGVPIITLCTFFGASSGSVPAAVLAGFANVPASSAIALATFAAIALLATNDATARFTKPFANIGRLGLSNYLLQTVICTAIFYYWGLGLFDSLTRIERCGVVVGVYVFQLIVSALWLQVFRIGPMEWLWRTCTYLKPQAMLRKK